MAQDNDPVTSGVVASLARLGGNITGLSNFAPELSSKRLEILREVIPKLSRVAVLGSSTFPSYALVMRELELAAKVLGVKLQYLVFLEPSLFLAPVPIPARSHCASWPSTRAPLWKI